MFIYHESQPIGMAESSMGECRGWSQGRSRRVNPEPGGGELEKARVPRTSNSECGLIKALCI